MQTKTENSWDFKGMLTSDYHMSAYGVPGWDYIISKTS